MSRCRVAFLGLAFVLLSVPAVPIHAQGGIELTPFAGGRFFGGLTDYTGAEVGVNDSWSFGGFLSYKIDDDVAVELGYSRQDTDASLSQPFQGRQTFDVKVDQWTLGVLRERAQAGSPIQPFGEGFLGLTHMSSSDGDDSITKFLLGGGLGAKFLRPASLLGLRLEARGYFTFAGSGGASVGCGIGGCGFGFSSDAFFQLDLIAGVILNLGGRR